MATKKFVVLLGMLVSLVLAANAESGSATYYTVYNPSACHGFNTPDSMVAAASPGIWDGGAACGRKYTVRCVAGTNLSTQQLRSGQSVTVQIVDLCPDRRGTIDLSQNAFAAIADIYAGYVVIEYDIV